MVTLGRRGADASAARRRDDAGKRRGRDAQRRERRSGTFHHRRIAGRPLHTLGTQARASHDGVRCATAGRPGTALVDDRRPVDAGPACARFRVAPYWRDASRWKSGEPLPNIQVVAIPMRLATAGGVAPALSRSSAPTTAASSASTDCRPTVTSLAALPSFGRGGEIQRRSDQELDTDHAQVAATQHAGGQGRACWQRHPKPLEATSRPGMRPTYFPGTAVAANATPTTVKAGDVRDGLSFTVSPVPIATISGTVIGVDGAPTQAVRLSMEPMGPPMPQTVLADSEADRFPVPLPGASLRSQVSVLAVIASGLAQAASRSARTAARLQSAWPRKPQWALPR